MSNTNSKRSFVGLDLTVRGSEALFPAVDIRIKTRMKHVDTGRLPLEEVVIENIVPQTLVGPGHEGYIP